MGFKITDPDAPPFIMTADMKKDVCILISTLPDNIQALVHPVEVMLGFNKKKYIPTSYANELGFYPVSGSGGSPNSGKPESGYYTVNSGDGVDYGSGSGSGDISGSGFASTMREVHERQNQNRDTRLRK